MKWSVLVWLLMVYPLYAQFTSVPDSYFEQYLEANGMGDGTEGNGLVLTANIENVTYLQLIDIGASDFTGLEDFVALDTLTISFTNATELDVSQNVNLKAFGLSYTTISSVDLSNLEELEELHLYRNSTFSVTLGEKPNLTYIDARENELESFDVSQCPVLEYLDLNENYLSSINVTNNPNLELLWVGINLITELDVSQNPHLFSLGLGLCAIPFLDLTHNPELELFNIALDDTIEYIDLRNGNNEIMQSFGATQCENLKCIYVDDPDAEYMDEWWYIEEGMHFVADEAECEALNTEDFFAKKILMYPNPIQDKLYIRNSGFEIEKIIVTDATGKIVINQSIQTEKAEIDMNKLPSGIYFVSAESKKGNFKTEKLIVK